jgi:probable HAF family extracellular repeat protein
MVLAGEGDMTRVTCAWAKARAPVARHLRGIGHLFALAVVAIAAGAPTPAAGQAASFQGLGFLPGETTSSAKGVNAFGTIVVGQSGSRAIRWVDGTMTGLPFMSPCGPSAVNTSTAAAVNSDGSALVGSEQSFHPLCGAFGIQLGFRWTTSTGIEPVAGPPLPACGGATSSSALGVSADGRTVVGRARHQTSPGSATCIDEAFYWVKDGIKIGLGTLAGGMSSIANGISADGLVVVGHSVSASGQQAFRWTSAGGMVGLGFLAGGSSSTATAVNSDGTVVVGGSDSSGGRQAFRVVDGVMSGLGMLPGGTSSDALGVSGDGSVVVGTSFRGGRNHAVRWTAIGGMRSIEDLLAAAGVSIAGWQLTSARAISADGSTIVGDGIDPSGRAQGWIVRFIASVACEMVSHLGDVSGDRKSDLVFRRNDGTLSLYLMDGFNVLAAQVLGAVGVEWRLLAVADFNGDGRADLLFRRNDGALQVYLMNGFQVLAAQPIGAIGTDWRLVAAADFDGDGRADMLFRRGDGMLALYLMNGTQVVAAQFLGAVGNDWRLVGAADFNGDGRADMLMRHDDGTLLLYLMNGFQILAAQVLGAVGNDWRVIGAADFNGDARADMLLRHDDGTLLLYLMNGFQIMGAQVLGALGTDWGPVSASDFNADSRADMLFRRDDGLLALYLMNGFEIQAAQVIGAVGTDWNSCHVSLN